MNTVNANNCYTLYMKKNIEIDGHNHEFSYSILNA